MTFAVVVLLGVGILLVTSAFEDVSITDTLKQLVSGQLSPPPTPSKEAAPPATGGTTVGKEPSAPVSEAPVGR